MRRKDFTLSVYIHMHTKEKPCEVTEESGHLSVRKRALSKIQPSLTLIWSFSAFRPVRKQISVKFLLFKPFSLWYFVMTTRANIPPYPFGYLMEFPVLSWSAFLLLILAEETWQALSCCSHQSML